MLVTQVARAIEKNNSNILLVHLSAFSDEMKYPNSFNDLLNLAVNPSAQVEQDWPFYARNVLVDLTIIMFSNNKLNQLMAKTFYITLISSTLKKKQDLKSIIR